MSEKMARSSGSNQQQGTSYDHRTTHAFDCLVSEIMDLFAAPSSTRHELEHLLSRYMKQEEDFALSEQIPVSNIKWNLGRQINMTGPRSLQLQFLNNICQPVFTGVPIKGKDQALMVALVDGQSGKVVTFGPEASTGVKIVVLEEDFVGSRGDSWTSEEFKSKIVPKEGKKRLLSGDVVLELNEGIGCVGVVQFSHTKTWKTKHAYRLGAMTTDDIMGAKIREGFTDSFEVRDHRLDLNKKHHPPTLSDDVWRLESIAKDGAFHRRLSDEEVNINTVEDLLKALNTNPQKLRDILGKGMYAKNWEALVNHARTCIVDERLHLFSSSGSSVLFNMVGQVIGLFSDFQYVSFEMMFESQKALAMKLVASAFQQWVNVVSFDDEASFEKYWGPSSSVYHLKSPIIESSSGINILLPPRTDEIDLPQQAISFDDKASLFDESPGLSNTVYPPKCPTMESFDGSKIIISPNFNEHDFQQSVISIDNKDSLLDESSSLSRITCPSRSLIHESSSGFQSLNSQENDELDFSPPAFSFDEDATLFHDSPPSKPPTRESSLLISPEINELDFPVTVVPSQAIIPNSDSVWDMSYFNDDYLQYVDHTGHRHEMHSSYSSQITDSDNLEMESIIRPWFEENQDFLQFSVDDVSLVTPALNLESSNNPQNDGNGPMMNYPTAGLTHNARKRYIRKRVKRKWRVLFSVMRCLFLCRNAAGKMQVKISSSYQDLQALDTVDSGTKQTLTIAKDFIIPTSYETKGFQIFSSHEKVFSRNLSMNSEANLHSAVNNILLARSVALATNIAQRKYLSKREKAQRRWTKLYSVMRWFSVQRNVTKRASYVLTVSNRNMLCSDQQNITSLACTFDEDEYVQLFNTFCSLQPRNRMAMNRIARRRNVADRNFAKRKWRMLFCIMKWLSVRRTSTRVKGSYNNC